MSTLLNSEPSDSEVTAEHLTLWRNLSLDIKDFEYFWARMVPECPKFDYENCKYMEGTASSGTKIKGLYLKSNNKSHGIKQQIKSDGNGGFFTSKNG